MARIKGKSGFPLSEETKKKIGIANKGVWIKYNCDYRKKENEEKQSHYKKKKRHFCNMQCYALFRKEKMHFTEQPSYKGIRQINDTFIKQNKRSPKPYIKLNNGSELIIATTLSSVPIGSGFDWIIIDDGLSREIVESPTKYRTSDSKLRNLLGRRAVRVINGKATFVTKVFLSNQILAHNDISKTYIHENPELLKNEQDDSRDI